MTAVHTQVCIDKRRQIIRLPKSVALPKDRLDVEVVAVGKARVISPINESWDAWFDGEGVSDDFMSFREQEDDCVQTCK